MRSANLIGQKTVIWSHWPVFHFSMNPVRIHEGRGHSRQNYFCDTVQCFYEEKWTGCNYWHFTLHLYFQVEKQKLTYIRRFNSSHADQLSAAIYSVSQPAKWCDHPGAITSCTCACFVCFQSSPAKNRFLNLLTVAWFIQHFLQFVFAFFNHSIKIAQFLFARGSFLFLSKPFRQNNARVVMS